ncbi:MAG: ExbD/TolR family protein [Phycisphaerae bacterium]
MRIPYEPPDETYPINVTNMIDVFLLLLIFFLVATTFAKEERDAKIQLPGTAAVRPISAPSKDLVLNIRQDGTVVMDQKELTGDQLLATLQQAQKADPERNLLIRADERSIMKYFAGVAREAREAGFSQLKIGYVIENPNTGQ